MPSAPITEPWALTISTLLGRWDRIPLPAMRALSVLDRAGSISVSPLGLGFDQENIEWSRITALTLLPVSQSLSKAALHHEVARLSRLLPPIPGRKRLADRIGARLSDLATVAFDRGAQGRLTVAEVAYRGPFGRTRRLPAGVFVTTVLGVMSPVNESVVLTAKMHGVEVSGA